MCLTPKHMLFSFLYIRTFPFFKSGEHHDVPSSIFSAKVWRIRDAGLPNRNFPSKRGNEPVYVLFGMFSQAVRKCAFQDFFGQMMF